MRRATAPGRGPPTGSPAPGPWVPAGAQPLRKSPRPSSLLRANLVGDYAIDRAIAERRDVELACLVLTEGAVVGLLVRARQQLRPLPRAARVAVQAPQRSTAEIRVQVGPAQRRV